MNSPITITALIATLLGVCFGFAAYWSARRRRKHEQEASPKSKPREQERVHIHAPLHTPPPSPDAAPASTEGTFFKQVGHDGKPPSASESMNDDDVYVWE